MYVCRCLSLPYLMLIGATGWLVVLVDMSTDSQVHREGAIMTIPRRGVGEGER